MCKTQVGKRSLAELKSHSDIRPTKDWRYLNMSAANGLSMQFIYLYIYIFIESLGFAADTNNVLLSLSNRNDTLGMLVSLGFALGTNNVLLSLSNRDNTLGMG